MILTGVALLVLAAYLMEAVEILRFVWAFLGSF